MESIYVIVWGLFYLFFNFNCQLASCNCDCKPRDNIWLGWVLVLPV